MSRQCQRPSLVGYGSISAIRLAPSNGGYGRSAGRIVARRCLHTDQVDPSGAILGIESQNAVPRSSQLCPVLHIVDPRQPTCALVSHSPQR